jgi:hypothetical protein
MDIEDLIGRYSRAVDTCAWDSLDDLFVAGAHIDYTALGGIEGDLAAVKAYLAETFASFGATQHMLGLPVITVEGDSATAVTSCHNPMNLSKGEDAVLLFCGLFYHHQFIRTEAGWRIADLREERVYMRIMPGK